MKIPDLGLYTEILKQVMYYLIVRWTQKYQILAWLEHLKEIKLKEIQIEWLELSKYQFKIL